MASLTSFTQRDALAAALPFQAQVRVAMVQSAGAIGAEGPVGAPPVHAKRLQLVVLVLSDPYFWAQRFAQAIASDAGLTVDNPTDATMLNFVAAWWNHFAGADV